MAFDISEYEAIVNEFYRQMEATTRIADIKLGEDKWTLKEMVGHLIDSASNNHQRFIRLQLENKLTFPAYEAEEWKNVSKLGGIDYGFLIRFWKQYNTFILYIIQQIDHKSLSNYWELDNSQKSLEYLVNDYFEHMRFHRKLFDERVGEIKNYIEQN